MIMNNIGIDILDVARMQKSLENPKFASKVFFQSEIQYCSQYKNFAEHFSGIFACKEAVMKALKTAGQYFLDIEITHMSNGAPKVVLHGKLADLFESEKLDVSISHIKDVAVAVCLYNQ